MTADQVLRRAMQSHQAGNLAEAEKLYRQVLQSEPKNADALNLLGTIAAQVGRPDTAIELLRGAISIKPENAGFHLNLANALRGKGLRNEAIAEYRQAVQLRPDYVIALSNLGSALGEIGQCGEAIDVLRRAVQLAPNLVDAHSNLCAALRFNGLLEEAIAEGRCAVRLRPDNADAQINLGNALREAWQPDAALAAYRKALNIQPDYPQAHFNLGIALADVGKLEDAIAAYSQALRLKPDYPQANINLGNALRDSARFDEAIDAYERALRLKPDSAEVHDNMGVVFKDMGRIEESIAACRRAVARRPDSAKFHSNLLLILHYHERFDAKATAAESFEWGRRHAEPLGKQILNHANDRDPNRRLKIGYVSADFRSHPVGRFFLPLIEAHDPKEVETFCYADVARPDATTERIRSHAQQWRDTPGMKDQRLTEQILADKIDILVDLAGHTGANRLLVFARKPAPVQVTWLGYPDTTGLSAMDYRITDRFADPPGTEDSLYSERLIRLPRTAWCYQSPDDEIPLNDTGKESRPVTFCSFNGFPKVNEPMLQTWSKILQGVPNSRLLLKSKALECRSIEQEVRTIFQAAGISSDRLLLQGWRDSHEDHLSVYRRADIALDTFPYHGTTTTCESLWMGVPVITLAGPAHVSRVGISLLNNVGLPDLIAANTEQYVEIAVNLGNSPRQLREIKSNLRRQMQASPLMDAKSFARDMEAAYRQMWRSWVDMAGRMDSRD